MWLYVTIVSVCNQRLYVTMQPFKVFLAAILPLCLFLVTGCDETSTVDTNNNDSNDPPIERTVEITGEFNIIVGETIRLEGTDLEFTFSAVRQESRCPSDVDCIHAGEATISITAGKRGNEKKDSETRIPGLVPIPYESNEVVRVGDFLFQLIRLEPYPDTSRPDDGPYRATFRIIE